MPIEVSPVHHGQLRCYAVGLSKIGARLQTMLEKLNSHEVEFLLAQCYRLKIVSPQRICLGSFARLRRWFCAADKIIAGIDKWRQTILKHVCGKIARISKGMYTVKATSTNKSESTGTLIILEANTRPIAYGANFLTRFIDLPVN